MGKGRFLHWAQTYALQTVAPDQDYLNALCWEGIHYLDPRWNTMPSESLPGLTNPRIIHFNLASKPWLNEHAPYEDVFWKYAALSGFEADIRARQEQFLRDTQAVRRYKEAIRKLIAMAARLAGKEQSFRSLIDRQIELRLCS